MVNRYLQNVFATMGLTNKHAEVYRALTKCVKATPLQLARETKLNRSSIYRYLEEMKSLGLVEEMLEANGSSYKTSGASGLELVINKQETKLTQLKESVPRLIEEMEKAKTSSSIATQIKYYQGVEGLKQMLWNIVKIKPGGEIAGYGYLSWNESVGRKYAESLRAKIVEKKLSDREINNTVGKLLNGKPWTEIPDYFRYHEERVLKPDVLAINHDTYIYDNVFAVYYFYQNELFGIEIHNAEIAKTQKQIFEILWKMAEKSR